MPPVFEVERASVVPVDNDTALLERGRPVDNGNITIKYPQCFPVLPPDSEEIGTVRRGDE